MSLNFWFNLILAVMSLLFALALIRSWKRGIIREWRARSLRQRLIPLTQSLVSSLSNRQSASPWDDLAFYRLREQAEELSRKSSPLSQEERKGLAKFLSSISSLHAKAQLEPLDIRSEKEEAILNGQRIAQDMREMGL